MVAPALKQEGLLGVGQAEKYRAQRLAHETVDVEMNTELLAQLKGFSGIQLEGTTVNLISSNNGSATYGVELRLTTNADLGIILQRMQSLGWQYQGRDQHIESLHMFTKTTSHPMAESWQI